MDLLMSEHCDISGPLYTRTHRHHFSKEIFCLTFAAIASAVPVVRSCCLQTPVMVQRALTSLRRKHFGVPEATGATNGPSDESTVYLNT